MPGHHRSQPLFDLQLFCIPDGEQRLSGSDIRERRSGRNRKQVDYAEDALATPGVQYKTPSSRTPAEVIGLLRRPRQGSVTEAGPLSS